MCRFSPLLNLHLIRGSLTAPHPEPWVRFWCGAGSGGSRTGPRPVYTAVLLAAVAAPSLLVPLTYIYNVIIVK